MGKALTGLGARGGLVLLCVAAIAVATGCGGSSSSGGGTATASAGGSTGTGGSSASKGDWNIVMSNSYTGNAWRKTMIRNFQTAAQKDVQEGRIKSFQVLSTSENTATEQIAQLKTLILKKPDAIVIDSASPTALNGVIQQACTAGITVVVFDSLATAPCAYKVAHNFVDYGKVEAQFMADQLNGKGNLVEVRGVSGSQPDIQIHQGIQGVLKQHPGLKVVATIRGEASQTTAQQAMQSVMHSLPPVDGILTQGGGDASGIIQAYGSSGEKLPKIALGNAGSELAWWYKQYKKDGYTTLSEGTLPSQSTLALGEAIDILNGQKVPKNILNVPILSITKQTLPEWAKATPANAIASPVFFQADVDKFLHEVTSGQKLTIPTEPTGS